MDPYKILGVSRDADMEDIKKAYRKLSRKYHPDANINNPNKKLAEEKFKQVQRAYQMIVDEREKGGSSASNSSQDGGYGYSSSEPYSGYGYGNSGYGNGYHGGYEGDDGYGYDPFEAFFGFGGYRQYRQGSANEYGGDPKLQAAARYINAGHFNEALNVLGGMDVKSADWYYLRACANSGLGNNVTAKQDAQTALNMNPNDTRYRELVNTLERGNSYYSARGGQYGTDCSGESALRCLIPCGLCCGLSYCFPCFPYGGFFFC